MIRANSAHDQIEQLTQDIQRERAYIAQHLRPSHENTPFYQEFSTSLKTLSSLRQSRQYVDEQFDQLTQRIQQFYQLDSELTNPQDNDGKSIPSLFSRLQKAFNLLDYK